MTTPKAKLAGFALIAALCAGFTLGLTAPAWATFKEGVAAYNRGDYATALREWRPLAEQGDAKAQVNLGLMYDLGRGLPRDYPKAMHWYRKAAEQGNANAQYNLGFLYAKGRGVPRDYAEAIQWFRKAAEQGLAKARFSLGIMYRKGQGVPRDYAETMQLWNKAAEQGLAKALLSLGLMYAKGLGVPQDDVQALKWFYLAAFRLPPGKDRDNAARSRDNLAAKMTPAQISEAERLARKWRPKK